MKLFGSITELVAAVFRKDSQAVTLRPNQATTYTASRDIQTPAQDADSILVSRNSTDTLSNKTLDNSTTATIKDANLTLQDDGDTTKQAKFQLSGITTGTTRTYTLPDVSDTVVTAASTSTLTNKTITSASNTVSVQDSQFSIYDNSDATKIAKFEASGITTGTTRTFTLPDADTTLVGTGTTQTLTGKSIGTDLKFANQAIVKFYEQTGNGTNYIGLEAPDAVTADKTFKLPDGDGSAGQFLKTDGSLNLGWASALSDPMTTRGDIIVRNSSNATARLAVGSANRLLASDGTDPSWAQINATGFFTSGAAATPTAYGVVSNFVPNEASSAKVVSSADYTILTTDGYNLVSVTTANSDRTVTLPAASSNVGRLIRITKVDTGSGHVVVTRAGSDTLNGSYSTYTLMIMGDSITLQAVSSSNWVPVAISRIPDSSVIVNTGNGHGSTNNRVRRFTNTQVAVGAGISYADSSTNAGSFTILDAGVYAISWTDSRTAGAGNEFFGISLNASGTTSITSLGASSVLQMVEQPTSSTDIRNVSVTVALAVNDVIRAHDTGSLDDTSNKVRFAITQVARTGGWA